MHVVPTCPLLQKLASLENRTHERKVRFSLMRNIILQKFMPFMKSGSSKILVHVHVI